MWFQGRDDDIAEEVSSTADSGLAADLSLASPQPLPRPQVVSLSTGRIFRATSNDGLRWEIEK